MGTLHWFLGLLFGLQLVPHAMGFSGGGFTDSCSNLSPHHRDFDGSIFQSQTSEQPFEVKAIADAEELITVTIGSPTAVPSFRGFMLEVWESDLVPANGSFLGFDPATTALMNCNNIEGSAVTQTTNLRNNFVQVKWKAREGGSSSFFLRATILESFTTFWGPVNVNISPAATTTQPTTANTPETSTEQPSTPLGTTTLVPTSTPERSTTAPPPPPPQPDKLKTAAALLIGSITFNGCALPQSATCKICSILQTILSLAAETISLILLFIWNSGCVDLIVLVCVVLFTSLIALFMSFLPLGTSHEKHACTHGCATQVVALIHEILLLAAIFLGLWKIECGAVGQICSLIMAGYTSWRFLIFFICLLIVNVFTKPSANGNGRGSDNADNRCRKRTCPKGTLLTVSIIFYLGNISFAMALLFSMFTGF